jgi:hypothetical protein
MLQDQEEDVNIKMDFTNIVCEGIWNWLRPVSSGVLFYSL